MEDATMRADKVPTGLELVQLLAPLHKLAEVEVKEIKKYVVWFIIRS